MIFCELTNRTRALTPTSELAYPEGIPKRGLRPDAKLRQARMRQNRRDRRCSRQSPRMVTMMRGINPSLVSGEAPVSSTVKDLSPAAGESLMIGT